MYSNQKKCLGNETIGSRSKAVIGILMVTLMLAFGLSILGVWGCDNANGVQSDVRDTPFIPDKNPAENKISEDDSSEIKSSGGDVSQKTESENSISDVKVSIDITSEAAISGTSDGSVAYKGLFGPFDVEAGSIDIVSAVLPDPEVDELPICITQDYLDNYGMIVAVKGGYTPVSGAIHIFQNKYCLQGVVEIVWTEVETICCTTTWEASLVLTDGNICLESNQLPTVGDDFCISGPDDLDKDVWMLVCSTWSGCDQPDQIFKIILAHKVCPRIPNSRGEIYR